MVCVTADCEWAELMRGAGAGINNDAFGHSRAPLIGQALE